MTEQQVRGIVARFVGTAVMVASVSGGVLAQKASPADVAAKLSGTWRINRELSPSFTSAPARGRAGGGAAMRPSFAMAGGLAQRGGGRGGDAGGSAGDLTPEEIAARGAIKQLQQIAVTVTIAATPESVSFTDSTGVQTYAIDGKSANREIAGAKISVKSRWDKLTLRQEFSSPQSKLIRSWEVDEAGHLVLKVRIESMTLMTPEVKAVFDRQ